MWIFFLILLQFAATKTQALGTKVDSLSMNFTYLNKPFLYNGSAEVFQYNETIKAHNMSFFTAEELPMDLRFAVDIYKFAAKAFRLFPYGFDGNVCDMFAKNEFGVRILYDYSNIRGCPFKKNVDYKVVNFKLDDIKMPTMPTGKYKVLGKLFSNSKKVTYFRSEWIASVLSV